MLNTVGLGKFNLNLSVPLVLEYEDVAKRLIGEIALVETDIDDILNYLCRISIHRAIFFLWRPFLKDPKDDLVLELAVASSSKYIVTYNKRHFAGVEKKFNIWIRTPKEFLVEIGEIK